MSTSLSNPSSQPSAESKSPGIEEMGSDSIRPLLFKSLRWDELCFYEYFLESIFHAAGKMEEPRSELRRGLRKKFRVFAEGVYEGKNKPPRTPLPHEDFLSRPQSTTLITQHNLVPLFKFSEGIGVAFVFDPASASYSRFIKSDTGTVFRPYDHPTREAAEAFLSQKRGEYFPDFPSFQEAIKGTTRYNEVMARICYDMDTTCIAVTKDNLESRSVAQFLAQKTLEALRVREEKRRSGAESGGEHKEEEDALGVYTVPLMYYLPGEAKNYQAYSPEAQIEDRRQIEALISAEDPEERNAYFSRGEFSFLLLSSQPSRVMSLTLNGKPVILEVLR